MTRVNCLQSEHEQECDIHDKALEEALEENYSGALSLYKKVLRIDAPVEQKSFIRVIDTSLELKAL